METPRGRWFLDEFSTGMDPILKRAVMELLRQEVRSGRTIVCRRRNAASASAAASSGVHGKLVTTANDSASGTV